MQIADQVLEKMLKVITPFVLSELEEVVSFNDLNDKQREDVLKVTVKSIEVSTVLFSKFLNDKSINEKRLDEVLGLIIANKMNEASDVVNDIQR